MMNMCAVGISKIVGEALVRVTRKNSGSTHARRRGGGGGRRKSISALTHIVVRSRVREKISQPPQQQRQQPKKLVHYIFAFCLSPTSPSDLRWRTERHRDSLAPVRDNCSRVC